MTPGPNHRSGLLSFRPDITRQLIGNLQHLAAALPSDIAQVSTQADAGSFNHGQMSRLLSPEQITDRDKDMTTGADVKSRHIVCYKIGLFCS